MREIPFKPDSPARQALKELKEGFDDPSLNILEPTLTREASLPRKTMNMLWGGEILHQIALRKERRGEIEEALRTYDASLARFRPEEVLGRARTMRDKAMLLCYYIDARQGLEVAREALALHDLDFDNQKGRRQRRVTQGYVWRAQILADEDRERALEEVIELALFGCGDFHARDQYVLVGFALHYAKGEQRLALHGRQLEIRTVRGKPLGVITSIAKIGIGRSLILTGRILKTIIRRE